MKIKANHCILRCICLSLCICLTACDIQAEAKGNKTSLKGSSTSSSIGTSASTGDGGYTAPPFATSDYSDANATTENGVSIDLSATSKGYVAVKASNPSRMKFIIRMDKQEYSYDLPNDGTVTIFPLQLGNGKYTFHGFQNTSGKIYFEILTQSADVSLESEFAPFLRPSQQVDYNASSSCVAMANELSKTASNEAELVAAVYQYVQKNIKYDYDFAKNAPKGYIPNPDTTLASKKGVCGDYAAIVAAMLRSQGIPTKVITGYVSPGDLYHAWNMIYLKDVGWITKEIQAPANGWQRIDLTFAANGSDANFIGDGSNYVDRYTY